MRFSPQNLHYFMMNVPASLDTLELLDEDRAKLRALTCPVPDNEPRRIALLQQTRLLDSSPNETCFDKFTHLSALIFNMPVSVITLVDVDRVWFKSRIGVDWTDISRNESIDAFTVLTDSPEVFIVPDISTDHRFPDFDLTYNDSPIRFYAGVAIMVEDVKIGTLCILDTETHPEFSAEDKENLLDICVGVSQLAHERRQHTLSLNTERANIVVSMMHNLRTPMTSLNCASALLAEEAAKLCPLHQDDDNSEDGQDSRSVMANAYIGNFASAARTPSHHLSTHGNAGFINRISSEDTTDTHGENEIKLEPAAILTETKATTTETKTTAGVTTTTPSSSYPLDTEAFVQMFSTFDLCRKEAASALKQLNLVVDSSLSLGQAVVKLNDPPTHTTAIESCKSVSRDYYGSLSTGVSERSIVNTSVVPSLQPGAPRSSSHSPNTLRNKSRPLLGGKPLAGPEVLLYPEMGGSRYIPCDLLSHIESLYRALVDQVVGVGVAWEVDSTLLGLGHHASYPEAVSLVLLSALGQVRTQHKNVKIRFHFERLDHEEDLEFPEIAHKLMEGTLIIRIQAYTKQERNENRSTTVTTSNQITQISCNVNSEKSLTSIVTITGTAAATTTAADATAITAEESITSSAEPVSSVAPMTPERQSADILLSTLQQQNSELGTNTSSRSTNHTDPSFSSARIVTPTVPALRSSAETSNNEETADQNDQYSLQYSFQSVNKILRTVDGSCYEFFEPIVPGEAPASAKLPHQQVGEGGGECTATDTAICMPTQEYRIPCKIILASQETLPSAALPGDILHRTPSLPRGPTVTTRHFSDKNMSLTYSSLSGSCEVDSSMAQRRLIPESMSTSAPTSVRLRPSMLQSPKGSFRGDFHSEKHSPLRGGVSSKTNTLPSATAGSASTTTATATVKETEESKALKVLIIEDTVPVQKLLSRWMQKAKCRVTCANNGSIGLNLLMTNCFDIVFVDFLMPVMLGVTTMKLFQAWVRENLLTSEIAAYNSQLLIVGMSATALESEQEAAFDYGMHFFCPKPADMEVLGMMLQAKRTCTDNEAALDMICAATNTDYFSFGQQELLCADMAEGEEGAEEEWETGGDGLSGTRSAYPSEIALTHQRRSSINTSQDWTEGEGDGNSELVHGVSSTIEGDSSAKASSTAGSGKDSERGFNTADSVKTKGSNVAGSPQNTASAMQSSSPHNAAGMNMSNIAGVHGKAVTDSKSAAMWSVFRSYRQSARSNNTAGGPVPTSPRAVTAVSPSTRRCAQVDAD